MARNESYITVGFEEPYIALYGYDASTSKVAYTNGMKAGRGVSVALEIEQSDDDAFYADDIIAESDSGQFVSGTATITIDGLDKEAAALSLGVNEVSDEATAENDKVYFDGDGVIPHPEIGFGYIVKQRFHGKTWYRVHLLPRVTFTIPNENAETSTDTINWQTQEITADILRSEETVTITVAGEQYEIHPWKVWCSTKYPSAAAALARLKAELGITN